MASVDSKPRSSHRSNELLLEQLQHRTLALETMLHHLAKQKVVKRSAYKKRLAALRSLQRELSRTQTFTQSKKSATLTETDIGLPRLEICSDEELAVCMNFLKERVSLAEAMRSRATTSLFWGVKAAQGMTGWLMATIRLSKLRKMVVQVDQWLINLEVEHQNANAKINRLMSDVRLRSGGELAAANVNGLIKLFDEINRLSLNVSRLRDEVRQEEQTVRDMNDYLRDEYQKLRLNRELDSAPSLASLTCLEKEIDRLVEDPIDTARDQLQVTKDFLKSQIGASVDNGLNQQLPATPNKKSFSNRNSKRKKVEGGTLAY